MRALESTSYANEEEEEGESRTGRARSLVLQGLSRSGLMDSWDPSFRPGLQQTSHLYMLPAESHHEHTANEPDVSSLLHSVLAQGRVAGRLSLPWWFLRNAASAACLLSTLCKHKTCRSGD